MLTVNSTPPVYGDVTDLKTFQEAKNVFIEAEKAFMSLDAKVRKEFDNDPAKFLDFMDNLDENRAEAERLGLAVPQEVDQKIEAPAPAPEKSVA